MFILKNPFFSVFFGDVQSGLDRDFLMDSSRDELFKEDRIAQIKQLLKLEELVLLRQTHGTLGAAVSDETVAQLLLEKPEGDFLVTDRQATGLGVYTADCLPIIVYDPEHRALGVCHAGWKGTVQRVVAHMLNRMKAEYGTDCAQVKVYFGPAAKACCYEVQKDFLEHLNTFSFKNQLIAERAGKLYFDMLLCNELQLQENGVKPEQCDYSYSTCTMCQGSYCSNRMNSACKDRQLTVATLN